MSGEKKTSSTEVSIPCVYFKETGGKNTRRTLEIASNRTEELGIQNVVVASSSGRTGELAVELFKVNNLVSIIEYFIVQPGNQLNLRSFLIRRVTSLIMGKASYVELIFGTEKCHWRYEIIISFER